MGTPNRRWRQPRYSTLPFKFVQKLKPACYWESLRVLYWYATAQQSDEVMRIFWTIRNLLYRHLRNNSTVFLEFRFWATRAAARSGQRLSLAALCWLKILIIHVCKLASSQEDLSCPFEDLSWLRALLQKPVWRKHSLHRSLDLYSCITVSQFLPPWERHSHSSWFTSQVSGILSLLVARFTSFSWASLQTWVIGSFYQYSAAVRVGHNPNHRKIGKYFLRWQ